MSGIFNRHGTILGSGGFTLPEVAMVLILISILTTVAVPRYADLTDEAKLADEQATLGSIKSAVTLYMADKVTSGQSPIFPPELDSSAAGDASDVNPFFGEVLSGPITNPGWSKSGFIYQGPAGGIYIYDPETGEFDSFTGFEGETGGWNFNEGDGGNIGVNGAGHELGDLINSPTWVEGVEGTALDFNNGDQYVAVPNAPQFDLTDKGSVGSWVYLDSYLPFAGIIHKGDAADFSDEAYTLQMWSGNTVMLGVRDASQNITILQSTAPLATGQWHHVVGTWDETGMKLYVNGQLNSSNTVAKTAQISAGNLNIGAQTAENYPGLANIGLDGRVDEPIVYNRALTDQEILDTYNIFNPDP